MTKGLGGTRRERGVALLIAVWLSLIVSLLAVAVARETRTIVTIGGNEMQAAQARLSAEAGVEAMALLLTAQARGEEARLPVARARASFEDGGSAGAPRLNGAQPLRLDGSSYRWAFNDALVEISAQAESGKFDLNTGARDLLPVIAAAAGAPDPERVAMEIFERRSNLGGARAYPWRISDAGFESVVELARLPSITPALYARLAPLVSTRSGLIEPDPLLAPQAIFDAAPLTRDERRRFEAERAAAPEPWSLRAPESYTVSARATLPGGATATATAMVEIAPRGAPALRFLSWSSP